MIPSFFDVVPTIRPVRVVDVGANPHDQPPPYAALLKAGRVKLLGFEPGPEAYASLLKRAGPNEAYRPEAVGTGKTVTFHHCAADVMSSVYPPNLELLRNFHWFGEAAHVVRREELETVRLDSIDEAREMDFLKIDIQGGELDVMQAATHCLGQAVAVQTEVLFLPMYEGQPLFAEIDQFMRAQGFHLHKFVDMEHRTLKPFNVGGDEHKGLSQLFWADAIYIKDFTRFGELPADKLLVLAALLHDLWGAFDFAFRALTAHDEKSPDKVAHLYVECLRGNL